MDTIWNEGGGPLYLLSATPVTVKHPNGTESHEMRGTLYLKPDGFPGEKAILTWTEKLNELPLTQAMGASFHSKQLATTKMPYTQVSFSINATEADYDSLFQAFEQAGFVEKAEERRFVNTRPFVSRVFSPQPAARGGFTR